MDDGKPTPFSACKLEVLEALYTSILATPDNPITHDVRKELKRRHSALLDGERVHFHFSLFIPNFIHLIQSDYYSFSPG